MRVGWYGFGVAGKGGLSLVSNRLELESLSVIIYERLVGVRHGQKGTAIEEMRGVSRWIFS